MTRPRNAPFLAVVPARGGSQGLPGKNLRAVQGISLVARAVLLAREIEEIKWVVISTDDETIAKEGARAGADVPFLRPAELSGPEVPMLKVLEHVYLWFRGAHTEIGDFLKGIVLLMPTSPMRKVEHVRGAIAAYQAACSAGQDVAAVHTVSRVPTAFSPSHHWHKVRDVDGARNGSYGHFRRVHKTTERPALYRNGAAVVLNPLCLDALNLKRGPVLPYVIDEPLVSIDSLYDLKRVEHCDRALEPA